LGSSKNLSVVGYLVAGKVVIHLGYRLQICWFWGYLK